VEEGRKAKGVERGRRHRKSRAESMEGLGRGGDEEVK